MGRARGLSIDAINGFGVAEVGRAGRTAGILARHGTRALRGSKIDRGARTARELKAAFAELGPTYVKLAQLIASSPGLFPEVLSDEFRSLLHEVPPIDADAVRSVIEADLGGAPEVVFAEFDYAPLASASIAQVHVARLHDGEEVVSRSSGRGSGGGSKAISGSWSASRTSSSGCLRRGEWQTPSPWWRTLPRP